MDSGNTAWVLASSALVLLMTPGLAFFYAGMVRGKNALGMLMQNFMTIGIVSIVWVLASYSIAFGPDGFGGLFGNLHDAGLQHLGGHVSGYTGKTLAQSIPPVVFVCFQLMFAVITPALFTGSIADRMKFGSFCVIVVAWSLLVYGPVAHWVFSPNGWAFKWGALDFAGGSVVHMNAGAAGLALALVLGKRVGWPQMQMRPHNLPFTLLGAGLLWFGWFGFNAGSALGANQLAGYAFLNTNTATAAAMIGWVIFEKVVNSKATTLGAASGAVAGLVAITPCAGYVSPLGSIAVGLMAGAVCAYACRLKFRFGFDDALDVVGVHLVGGFIGTLSVGLFSTTLINSAGTDGLFYGGGFTLLGKQFVVAIAVIAYSFSATLLIALVVRAVMGLRVTRDDETAGLDTALHAETAYEIGSIAGSGTHGASVPKAVHETAATGTVA
ncbi:MAG: ammonium transporter [Actinomycetota bacterium]|nr:ammonium transporter [Actinomycetota bacterium]